MYGALALAVAYLLMRKQTLFTSSPSTAEQYYDIRPDTVTVEEEEEIPNFGNYRSPEVVPDFSKRSGLEVDRSEPHIRVCKRGVDLITARQVDPVAVAIAAERINPTRLPVAEEVVASMAEVLSLNPSAIGWGARTSGIQRMAPVTFSSGSKRTKK